MSAPRVVVGRRSAIRVQGEAPNVQRCAAPDCDRVIPVNDKRLGTRFCSRRCANRHNAQLRTIRHARSVVRALIADDAYATQFQSLGQYRTALLAALDAPVEGQ